MAWKLQEPGCVCYEKIVAHFGTEILREDRTINRGILGEIVFGNAEEMAVLNGIVHPEVKAYIKEQIVTEKKIGTSCFVLEAALYWKITMMKSVMNSGIFIRKNPFGEFAETIQRIQR